MGFCASLLSLGIAFLYWVASGHIFWYIVEENIIYMNGFEELSEVTFFNPFLQKKFSRIRKESAQDKWDYCIWNFYNDITYTLVKVKATLDNNIRSSKVSGNFDHLHLSKVSTICGHCVSTMVPQILHFLNLMRCKI